MAKAPTSSVPDTTSEPFAPEVEAILQRPYARVLLQNPEGIFTARVLEFPGAISEGEDANEAMRRLDDALGLVVEVMLDRGDPIPQPLMDTEYNGRISLRIPPALHEEVAHLASATGVSMNRFLSDAIARHVGAMSAQRKPGSERSFPKQSGVMDIADHSGVMSLDKPMRRRRSPSTTPR